MSIDKDMHPEEYSVSVARKYINSPEKLTMQDIDWLRQEAALRRKDRNYAALCARILSKEVGRLSALSEGKPTRSLFDLMRYMRSTLLSEGLIDEEEYIWIAVGSPLSRGGGSPSPRRLEDYDKIRARMTALEAELNKKAAALRRAKENLKPPQDNADEEVQF